VVFISSVNGRLSTPMVGACAASKFALEAAADALRMELRPWSIPVVLIEPAQTDTDMWRRAPAMVDDAEATLSPEQRALYARHISGMRKSIPVSQRMAVDPKRVAAVVIKALTEKRPRARYAVGAGPKLQLALLTRLPATFLDRLLRSVMRQP
jgi:short-subunit dehydrogenase